MEAAVREHHGILVLVHTVAPLVDVFEAMCADLLPGITTFHILDQPLLERVRRNEGGGDADVERLVEHVALAASIAADAVLVTCSTISTLVDRVRERFALPIVRIDEAMAEEAVRLGPRIALVATSETTIDPSRALIASVAARSGRPVVIESRVVEGALSALLAGTTDEHDRMVEHVVRDLVLQSDVVVLAQASMARVMPSLAGRPVGCPVLSSPELALGQVASLLMAPALGQAGDSMGDAS